MLVARAALVLAAVYLALGCSGGEQGLSLPYEERFSDGDCDWPTEDADEILLECADGAYRALVRDASNPQVIGVGVDTAVGALSFAADVIVGGGMEPDGPLAYGVSCWSSWNDDEGYHFLVGSDGSVAIMRSEGADDRETLVERGAGAVAAGRKTRVRGVCVRGPKETTLVLSSGDAELVAKDEKAFGPFGSIGFFVSASRSGTELRFDNVDAHMLSLEEARATRARGASAPADEPDAAAPRAILLQERFARRSPSWPQDATSRVEGGVYRIRVPEPNSGLRVHQSLNERVAGVRIDVDLKQRRRRPAGQEYGVSCLLDETDGYLLTITADERSYGIWKESERSRARLGGGIRGAIRGPAAPNHLRVDCRVEDGRAHLSLWVNGRSIADAVDPGAPEAFNGLALVVESLAPGADASFDNLVARELR